MGTAGIVSHGITFGAGAGLSVEVEHVLQVSYSPVTNPFV